MLPWKSVHVTETGEGCCHAKREGAQNYKQYPRKTRFTVGRRSTVTSNPRKVYHGNPLLNAHLFHDKHSKRGYAHANNHHAKSELGWAKQTHWDLPPATFLVHYPCQLVTQSRSPNWDQTQHTSKLISPQKTSHKHNKDPGRLQYLPPGTQVNMRYKMASFSANTLVILTIFNVIITSMDMSSSS